MERQEKGVFLKRLWTFIQCIILYEFLKFFLGEWRNWRKNSKSPKSQIKIKRQLDPAIIELGQAIKGRFNSYKQRLDSYEYERKLDPNIPILFNKIRIGIRNWFKKIKGEERK